MFILARAGGREVKAKRSRGERESRRQPKSLQQGREEGRKGGREGGKGTHLRVKARVR